MIKVLDGIITADVIGMAAKASESAPWKYGWHSTKSVQFSHWNHEIVQVNKRNISPLTLAEPYVRVWDEVKDALPIGAFPIRCYANCHTYGVEGYPHTDSLHDEETTTVIYLNREWKREWGGETAFYDGQENIKSVMPAFGRVVMFASNIVHCARSVSRICPVARMTLIIKARHVQSPDTLMLEGFLEHIGAHKMQHKHGSLKDHLVRTYELLKHKKAPRHVALAGGLHSIYGTSAYKQVCTTDRAMVSAMFGMDAEELACQFGRLENRTQTLEQGARCDLQLIEAANLRDQGSLDKKWPNLKAVWDG